MPTKALVATRHLLRDGATRARWTSSWMPSATPSRPWAHTHDYIEGVMAFLEKRTAQFKGE
jgi:2-(1,2-epoxy-1,2-dihydrophenyl)acetyl-CoA isomerase